MVHNFIGGKTKAIDSKFIDSPTESLEDLDGCYIFGTVSNGVMEGVNRGV